MRQAVSTYVVLEPRGADTLLTVAALVNLGGDIPASVVNSRLGEMAGFFENMERLGQSTTSHTSHTHQNAASLHVVACGVPVDLCP